MVEKKTFLRVLYTINSSPQYILARSQSPVTITLVPPAELLANSPSPHDAHLLYATVCLKTCLQTICRSSPELTQDVSRDFSIYVLDPLESNSIPPLDISSRGANLQSSTGPTPSGQRGMAVGLGLMSWALAADESDAVTVAGTLMKRGTTQEALEVVFALRETMAMKQPAWSSLTTSEHAQDSSQSSDIKRDLPSNQNTHLAAGQASLSSTSWQSASASYSFTSNTRETLASIHLRAKTKVKPPKPIKQSTTPITESDKFLNAETYIGPLKKKGRPKTSGNESKAPPFDADAVASGSNDTQEVIVIDSSDSDGSSTTPVANTFQINPTAAQELLTQQGSKMKRKRPPRLPTTPPFSTGPLIRRSTEPILPTAPQVQPKVESEELNLLDVLAYISATSSSSEPHTQNAAILAAINAIDSPENMTEPTLNNSSNPALLSALKQLLTLYAKPAISSHPPTVQPPALTQSSSQDDGIVILDKENVNPTVFRKGSQKETSNKKNQPSVQSHSGSRVSGRNSPSERPVQSLGFSSRSKENSSSTPSLKETVSTLTTDRIVRKRTLSDFMDEKETRSRNKGKGKRRGEKQDAHLHRGQRSASTAGDTLRHYPRLVDQPRSEPGTNSYYRTGMEPWTSPPRSTVDSADPRHTDENTFTSRTSAKPASPKTHVSVSSPSRSQSNRKTMRRKYVVPEWARTSTATQPRLSEEAQRAIEEAEERKKQERVNTRQKLMQSKPKRKNEATTLGDQAKSQQPEREPPSPRCDENNGPVAARGDCPVFAAADISFPILSSSRPSSPTPNHSSQLSIPKTPKTPTRNKYGTTPISGEVQDSLFTPTVCSGSLFGSALSSRSTAALPILTSPLGNRKKAKLSPKALAFSGRILYLSPRTPVPASEGSSNCKKSDDDEAWKKALADELESALDDLDGPPSSLPIAASDMEVEQVQPEPSAHSGVDPEDDMDIMPVKQHWAGLPPSSPPAPSSPLLMPEADEMEVPGYDEMDDIPIATSDSEVDTDMDAFDGFAPPLAVECPAANDDMLHDEFSNFAQETSPGSMELFEQFTNLNAQSDDLPSLGGSSSTVDPSVEAMFQNSLDGIDFTEFWETFKPLVNDNLQSTTDTTNTKNIHSFGSIDDEHMLASLDELDHTKLAGEIQALFSGCLM